MDAQRLRDARSKTVRLHEHGHQCANVVHTGSQRDVTQCIGTRATGPRLEGDELQLFAERRVRERDLLADAGERLVQTQVETAVALYTDAGGRIPPAPGSPENLVHARWMLEEFRVSLFAQTLGTSQPVSLQRILRALAT